MGFTDEERATFAQLRSILAKQAGHRHSPLRKALSAYDALNKCFMTIETIQRGQRALEARIGIIKESDAAYLRSIANRGQPAH